MKRRRTGAAIAALGATAGLVLVSCSSPDDQLPAGAEPRSIVPTHVTGASLDECQSAATELDVACTVVDGPMAGYEVGPGGALPHPDEDLTYEQCLDLVLQGASGCYADTGSAGTGTYLIPADSPQQCAMTTSPDPSPEIGRSLCLVTAGADRGATFPIDTS